MKLKTQSYNGKQLTLSTIFPEQIKLGEPLVFDVRVPDTKEEELTTPEEFADDESAFQREVEEDIKARIQKLRKEIEDKEKYLATMEEAELDLEPEPGEEDIFDGLVPSIEADLTELRYMNELDIRELECELAELQEKEK